MGYTTDFDGAWTCTPALNESQVAYLKEFNATRRMGRNETVMDLPDPLRDAVGLPVGLQGGYYVGGEEGFEQ